MDRLGYSQINFLFILTLIQRDDGQKKQTLEERTTEPHMTESEKAKGYHLEWMTPEEIVKANEPFSKEPWIYRDTAFIKMLMEGNL